MARDTLGYKRCDILHDLGTAATPGPQLRWSDFDNGRSTRFIVHFVNDAIGAMIGGGNQWKQEVYSSMIKVDCKQGTNWILGGLSAGVVVCRGDPSP